MNHNAAVVQHYPRSVVVSFAADRLFAKLAELKFKLTLKDASSFLSPEVYSYIKENGLYK